MPMRASKTRAPAAAGGGMYNAEQYGKEWAGSLSSARVIVPLLLERFPSRSVVDFGCGLGTWLSVFRDCGVAEYRGYDGYDVPPEQLFISPDRLQACDLRRLSPIGGRYDLACSLEVAEHLPPSSGALLVEILTRAAPVVLFSAAIPGQRGPGHVNEQWQDHWARIFADHGFRPFDCLRPVIWGDDRVCWWYQQNILVYCDEEHHPAPDQALRSLNVVHPAFLETPLSEKKALRALLRALGLRAGGFFGRRSAAPGSDQSRQASRW